MAARPLPALCVAGICRSTIYKLSVRGIVESASFRVVRFGVFEMDLDARELRKRGVRVKLQDQPFRVLALLIERSGQIVAREEIKDSIWAEDTFVEFDHGLNTAVQKIRQALGDSATSPRFLETIPRRGYRFVGSVEFVPTRGGRPDVSLGSSDSLEPAPAKGRRAVLWAAAVAAVALAAFSGGWLLRPANRGPGASAPPVPTPLTTYAGRELNPSFSPDGTRIIFAWEGEDRDNWDLYVKVIGEPSLQRLTDDPAADFSPVWSPDGRRIAFLRATGPGSSDLMIIPSIGGGARSVGPTMLGSGLLAWHPGGRHIFAAGGDEVQVVSIDTGDVRPIGMSGNVKSPAISPDGRRLAYVSVPDPSAAAVYVQELSDSLEAIGTPRRLITPLFARDPAWTADGGEIIIAVGRDRRTLWRVPADGGEARPLVSSGLEGYAPAISPQGYRLAFVRGREQGDLDVWRARLPDGREAEPLIASTWNDLLAQYSPNGRQIAFSSNRSGYREIWACSADGGNPIQLTHLESVLATSPFWSPDGRQIAFDASIDRQRDIMTIRAAGGQPRNLTSDPAQDRHPTWSRDGRWIYFSSDRSGDWHIWKIPAEGGDAEKTAFPGTYALQSMDGQTLFYNDQGSIWSSTGGSKPKLAARDVIGSYQEFFAVDAGLFFADYSGKRPGPRSGVAPRQGVGFIDGRSGETKILFEMPGRGDVGISVSPDGSHILRTQALDPEADIMLVEGFH